MIPPPIVQSVRKPSPGQSTRSIVFEQPAAQLEREDVLQADLQFLLDAQAEGLLKGLGKDVNNDDESNGSVTPTTSRVVGYSARKETKPKKRRPGLRSARKGIYNSILALSEIKDEELQTADSEVLEKEEILERISEWEQKRQGLLEATDSIQEDEETIRSQRFGQEANVLQEEINNMEMQLSNMKARHRKLVRQAADAENSVQAKLASYTSSLSLLEADVRKFLSAEPDHASSPQLGNITSSMWQLPPKRRTLEMALSEFDHERDVARRRRGVVEQEKEALDEGAKIWGRVVTQISEFERLLRSNVPHRGGHSSESSTQAWEDQEEDKPEDPIKGLKALLDTLSVLVGSLENDLKHVHERRWNLLIAAIGAELEALRQGQSILEGLVGNARTQHISHDDQGVGDGGDRKAQGEEIHSTDQGFAPSKRQPSSQAASDTDEDAAPEELLFSKHAVDTD